MPSDALLSQTGAGIGVQTSTFHTAGVTLGKSRIFNNLYMRVIYNAASNVSGANAWTFTSELSLDGGTSWSTMSGLPPINLSTTAQSGEAALELDLNSPLINPTMANAPIVRLAGTLSGAGASPTINIVSVEIVPTVI